mgnify:CR=1 FL=1
MVYKCAKFEDILKLSFLNILPSVSHTFELEQSLFFYFRATGACYYLLTGDLNARIGKWGLMMDDADDNDVSNGFEKYHVL